MDRVRSPVVWAGILLAIASFFVYWLSNRAFDAGRGDLFYLADAFLHGRTWLDSCPGPFDIIYFDDHVYVPFAPFPAIVLMPLVAAVGRRHRRPVGDGDQRVPRVDGRPARLVGVRADRRDEAPRPLRDGRAARVLDPDLVGDDPRRRVAHGPPHRDDPHAVAAGRDVRPQAGVPHGPARRGRVPHPGAGRVRGAGRRAVADPLGGRWTSLRHGSFGSRIAALPWAAGCCSASACCPPSRSSSGTTSRASATPLESGYALATLPAWLQAQRDLGLFSTAHIPMNLDYLFWKVPDADRGVPVLPARRPRDVGADHEPGAAARPSARRGATAGRGSCCSPRCWC